MFTCLIQGALNEWKLNLICEFAKKQTNKTYNSYSSYFIPQDYNLHTAPHPFYDRQVF